MGKKRYGPERIKPGPGRKSRKQKDPNVPKTILGEEQIQKKLSSRVVKRIKKRLRKNEALEKKKKERLDGEDDDFETAENDEMQNGDMDEKPKLNLDSDSADESDESSSDGSDMEQASRKLDKESAEMEEQARLELQTNIAAGERFVMPTVEELQLEENQAPDLQFLQHRVKELCFVLADFTSRREPNRARSEYTELLLRDLCRIYSYNEFLMGKFMELFSVSDLQEFLEANEAPRPVTLRSNGLKTRRRDLARALISRGVNVDPLPWTKVGLVAYDSAVPLGATPEYLAGHYILQGASSLMPVMALAPQPGEKVMDMCSAPGGKTTHIAALMRNSGLLVANDANRDRLKALVGNLQRMGIINIVVTNEDGRKLPKHMSGFDRILLDAPCSGTGVISKDTEVKASKDEKDIQRCSHLQRELLLSAIDALDHKSSTGGYIVYSTCSLLVEENEAVVQYALEKRNVKVVPTGLPFGEEAFVSFRQHRFHPSMNNCRRYYPHTHNLDGFFVAKLKKFAKTQPKTNGQQVEEEVAEDNENEGVEVEQEKMKKRSKK